MFTVTDNNPNYQTGEFNYSIDWGDGSAVQLGTATSGLKLTHAFNVTGAIVVSAAATDAGGAQSAIATRGVQVDAVQLRANANDPRLTDVVWAGTTGDDNVTFEQIDATTIRIREQLLNGLVVNQQQDVSGIAGRLIAYGNPGSDRLVATGLQSQVTLDGGAGNNTLYGGNGGDILIGGDGAEGKQGNNVIIAGNGDNVIYGNGPIARKGESGGNNLIIGGTGDDTIYGNFGANQVTPLNPRGDGGEGGQNLIVAGGGADTVYASQIVNGPEGGKGSILISGQTSLGPTALLSVLAEWTSDHTQQQKLANIQGQGDANRLNSDNFLQFGVTLTNDGAVDQLFSDTGGNENWLLYAVVQDEVVRAKQTDILTTT
jgi:hypothetical protein